MFGEEYKDLSLDELISLKWFSKKLGVKMSTEFICFRTGRVVLKISMDVK
jgi:hypothetical protein